MAARISSSRLSKGVSPSPREWPKTSSMTCCKSAVAAFSSSASEWGLWASCRACMSASPSMARPLARLHKSSLAMRLCFLLRLFCLRRASISSTIWRMQSLRWRMRLANRAWWVSIAWRADAIFLASVSVCASSWLKRFWAGESWVASNLSAPSASVLPTAAAGA